MKTRLDKPVEYTMQLGDDSIVMNKLLGQKIQLSFQNQINCIACGRVTKKSFAQGFCFPCFKNSPQNSECIIKPELCEGHLGKGRDAEWEEKHHNQPHIVYLAFTAGVKVGVTRDAQIPTRWIDQGASRAIVLAETPYRQIAGEIEVALKEHMSDKTNWRSMLKNEIDENLDPLSEKEEAIELLPEPLQEFVSDNDEVTQIEYPSIEFPRKVKSLGFDKQPEIEGTLEAIKGQYLLFNEGRVLNLRKHNGYLVQLNF